MDICKHKCLSSGEDVHVLLNYVLCLKISKSIQKCYYDSESTWRFHFHNNFVDCELYKFISKGEIEKGLSASLLIYT